MEITKATVYEVVLFVLFTNLLNIYPKAKFKVSHFITNNHRFLLQILPLPKSYPDPMKMP